MTQSLIRGAFGVVSDPLIHDAISSEIARQHDLIYINGITVRYYFSVNSKRPIIIVEPPLEALGTFLSSVCAPVRLRDFRNFLVNASGAGYAHYAHDYAEVEIESDSQTAIVFIDNPASDITTRLEISRGDLMSVGHAWLAHLEQSDWYRQNVLI